MGEAPVVLIPNAPKKLCTCNDNTTNIPKKHYLHGEIHNFAGR